MLLIEIYHKSLTIKNDNRKWIKKLWKHTYVFQRKLFGKINNVIIRDAFKSYATKISFLKNIYNNEKDKNCLFKINFALRNDVGMLLRQIEFDTKQTPICLTDVARLNYAMLWFGIFDIKLQSYACYIFRK